MEKCISLHLGIHEGSVGLQDQALDRNLATLETCLKQQITFIDQRIKSTFPVI